MIDRWGELARGVAMVAGLVAVSTAGPPAAATAATTAAARGPEWAATIIEGTGFLTDATHPTHPGDVKRHEIRLRLMTDRALGESLIEVAAVASPGESPDRYFVRRGRIFQVDERGGEVAPRSLGDLSAATLAALHPTTVATALADRPENAHALSAARRLFAWNGELWTVDHEPATGRIVALERATYDEVHGDGREVVRFEAWAPEATALDPDRVVVTARGREIARFDYTGRPAVDVDSLRFPAGDRARDRTPTLATREIRFAELAPGIFAVDLDTLNTRVIVAEFADHVFVLEGAFDPRASDRLADAVKTRFAKPPRWFAFSHIHGQYVAGTRSWVAAGAAIVVPPATVPLVEQIVAASFASRPDRLARAPRPLRVETVAARRRFEDAVNALEVIPVESDHTDDYFVFWFPRAKLLVSGDLYFWREGRKVTGRSKKLCGTVASLGLEPRVVVATWPLHGYGTKSVVTGEEFSAACAPAP